MYTVAQDQFAQSAGRRRRNNGCPALKCPVVLPYADIFDLKLETFTVSTKVPRVRNNFFVAVLHFSTIGKEMPEEAEDVAEVDQQQQMDVLEAPRRAKVHT